MDDSAGELVKNPKTGKKLIIAVAVFVSLIFVLVFLYFFSSTILLFIDNNFERDSKVSIVASNIHSYLLDKADLPSSKSGISQKIYYTQSADGAYYYTFVGYYDGLKFQTEDMYSKEYKMIVRNEIVTYSEFLFISPFTNVYWSKKSIDNNINDFQDIKINDKKSDENLIFVYEGEKFLKSGDLVSLIFRSKIPPEKAIIDGVRLSDEFANAMIFKVIASR